MTAPSFFSLYRSVPFLCVFLFLFYSNVNLIRNCSLKIPLMIEYATLCFFFSVNNRQFLVSFYLYIQMLRMCRRMWVFCSLLIDKYNYREEKNVYEIDDIACIHQQQKNEMWWNKKQASTTQSVNRVGTLLLFCGE